MAKTYKYIPHRALRLLNNKAIRYGMNRAVTKAGMLKLLGGAKAADEVNFPIIYELLHNDHEMRCLVVGMVNDEEVKFWLDMDIDDYGKLPTFVFEEGEAA